MTRWIGIAIAAVLAIAVGGYLLYNQLSPSGVTTTPVTVSDGPQQSPLPTVTAPEYKEAPTPEFAFRRLEIQTSQEVPEACLVFTRKLDSTGKTRYEDYLALEPQISVAVRATEDRLCIGGLAFNESYTLEMKEGLPAGSGEKLTRSESIPVQLRDQEPKVAFGNGFILPRESMGGVPISTINIDELDLKIIRVGDRLLSQLQTGIIDQREMYPYEASQYENEQGALVWHGRLKTKGPRNQVLTTGFPIREALGQQKPGVYMILAKDAKNLGKTTEEDDEYWRPAASQWVIDSDMGLTSFRSDEGLTVFVRSFNTATPMGNVKLQLIARNNEILGEATTDSKGRADFEAGKLKGTGGNEPVVVMAYWSSDFAYLDLRRPAFDLTDRGVEGRAVPGPIDAYLYLDRGIYRPGETVQLVTMLRDRTANAMGDMPLTIVVSRPDGTEFKRLTVTDEQQGGAHTPFTLTATAPRGRWQAAAYADPTGAPIGRIGFDVQDFVPQRLKVTLTSAAEVLKTKQEFQVKIESRFLYGAPAAGLSGEGELTITRDPKPFEKFKEYRFGRVDETFDGVVTPMTVDTTDDQGNSLAHGIIETLTDTSLPLQAKVRVSLFEPGGRSTDEQIMLPVRTRDVMLGIDPLFDGDTVADGAEAPFDIIAVDEKGAAVARSGITYELVREEYGYNWFRTQEGEWRYEETRRDRIVAGGALDLKADAPTRLGQVVSWGSYRLTVADPVSGASSAVRFWSGWYGGTTSDKPDRVAVMADKKNYKVGDVAKLTIQPPTDGKALVVLATDKVFKSDVIEVAAGGGSYEIPVTEEMGGGVYALVTHYKPLSSAQTRAPVRAIGLVWLEIDTSSRTLTVDIGLPEQDKTTPRKVLDVPLKIGGVQGETFVTLAAVDEGILQLTDFVSPDPAKYYYGKRQLGMQIRDDYGRLIQQQEMQVGELRAGGDGFGGRSLAVVPQRTVALFSGLVKVGGDGSARISLDIPDFNGELRLMAVAYGPSQVGSASKPLTVRDQVVSDVVLPRFLAPGDNAAVALNLHNVEGAAGAYKATVKGSGPISATGGAFTTTQTLASGQRVLVPVTLQTSGTGIGTVTLALEGPSGFKVERAWPIEIRAPQLPQTREEVVEFKAGETVKLGRELLAGIIPGTEAAAVTVTGARGYDNIPGMLKWLDRYPYGCLEQTTSRAMPLVYYNDMAILAGLKTDQKIEERVQTAIDRVLDMQTYSGGFALWAGGSDEVDIWLASYAIDFLLRSKEKGYLVPREGLERSMKYLRKVSAQDSTGDSARAYAFYLLSRQGMANASDLRYFADTRMQNVPSALGAGMLGVALTNVGDKARAKYAFERAKALGVEAPLSVWWRDQYYDSPLRDNAGLTAMAAEAGQDQLVQQLIARTSEFRVEVNYTTTQEKGWMLLAAHKIEEKAAPVNVRVDGVSGMTSGKTLRLAPTTQELEKGISLTNNGTQSVWRVVSVDGVPSEMLPATSEGGLTVSKTYFTMDGAQVTPSQMKQNDRLIVLVKGQMSNNLRRQMAVLDLLPAGWEIEAPVGRNEDGSSLYSFLPALTPTSTEEKRDDRYVAAFFLGTEWRDEAPNIKPAFALAYIVRAITPGTYVLPAVSAEDMYAPHVKARTAPSSVTIAAAQ
jgi:alpha-2-macroglobulin